MLSLSVYSFSVLESLRPCPWPRGASKTVWHVLGLGLEAQVLGLGHGLGLGDQVLGLGLGLGLEVQVLGIGFDLGVSVMSAAVGLTLHCSTPQHRWKQ